MVKRTSSWRKAEVTRFIEAVRASGVPVGRVELEGDKIVIVSASDAGQADTPLDEWLKSNARKA
jgi:hypothetical protein